MSTPDEQITDLKRQLAELQLLVLREPKRVPTIGPLMERLRDLIAVEGELGDTKEQLAEAQAACAAMKTTIDFIYHLRQFPNPDWGALDIKILERLSSCTCGQSLLDELDRYRKALEFYGNPLTWRTGPSKNKTWIEDDYGQTARNALNQK